MEKALLEKNDGKYLPLITVLSVAIPVVVAVLIFLPQTGKLGDLDVSFLPGLNAVLNSATTLCLLGGLWAIRGRNERLHRSFMVGALALSSLFLVSYVVYHFQGAHTLFGDANADGVVDEAERVAVGGMRTFYLGMLLSHIVLATAVVPLVLLAVYFALSDQRAKHRRIVRWTYPIWLYVAVTGVWIYFLISPYYPY
jgi:putative membrane protein